MTWFSDRENRKLCVVQITTRYSLGQKGWDASRSPALLQCWFTGFVKEIWRDVRAAQGTGKSMYEEEFCRSPQLWRLSLPTITPSVWFSHIVRQKTGILSSHVMIPNQFLVPDLWATVTSQANLSHLNNFKIKLLWSHVFHHSKMAYKAFVPQRRIFWGLASFVMRKYFFYLATKKPFYSLRVNEWCVCKYDIYKQLFSKIYHC